MLRRWLSCGVLVVVGHGSLCVSASSHSPSRSLRKGPQDEALAPPPSLQAKDQVTAKMCYEPALEPLIDKEKYPFCKVLEEGKLVMYWTHDGAEGQKPSKLSFGVAAKTTADYVALGFSGEAQGMGAGMDVAMLRKNQEGMYQMEDRWSTSYTTPEMDVSQDKTLNFVQAHPEVELLVYGFEMPVDGMETLLCKRDRQDAILEQGRWHYVNYAFGSNEKSGEPGFHGEDIGMLKVPLLATPEGYEKETKPIDLPADVTTVEVRLPETEVPATDTTYMCLYYEPPHDQKYHIYSVQLVGEKDTLKRFVHHAIIYQVHVSDDSIKPGHAYECGIDMPTGRGTPMIMASHTSLTSPSDQAFEEVDAALPLGKGYAQYWLLEVHYNNPELVAGVKDSTGFQITFSPHLRTHDAGMITVGSVPNIAKIGVGTSLVIPPGVPRYDHLDYCPSTCTTRLLPPQGVHIMFTRVHMHMLASGGELQIVHPEVTTDPVARSVTTKYTRTRLSYLENWDFDHQEGQSYAAPGVPLMPGDRIITRCTYNSTLRTNKTTWGESAHDEMCLGYLLVYPAPDSSLCMDLRNASDRALDAWRHQGVYLNLTFCPTLSQYSNATVAASIQEFDNQVARIPLVQNIPADELNAKYEFEDPVFTQSCPASSISRTQQTQSHTQTRRMQVAEVEPR